LTVMALDDDTSDVRRSALAATVERHGESHPEEVAALLTRVLAKKEEDSVHLLALKSLAQLAASRAVDYAAQDLVGHSSSSVRTAAAEILAEHGPIEHARTLADVFARRRLSDYTYKPALTTYTRRFGYDAVKQILAGRAVEHFGSCTGPRYLSRSSALSSSPGGSHEGGLLVAGTELPCIAFVGNYVLLGKDGKRGWIDSQVASTEDPRTFFGATGADLKGYLVAGLFHDNSGGNLAEVRLTDGQTVAIRSILEVTVGSDGRMTFKTQAGDISGAAMSSSYGGSSDLFLVLSNARLPLTEKRGLKLLRVQK
jgi:hypothetical protein